MISILKNIRLVSGLGAALLVPSLIAAEIADARDIDYLDAPGNGVELGLGWDSATGTLLPSRCIRFAPVQEGGQVLNLQLDEASDSSELAENLDVSAQTTLQGMIGSVSAKANFVKNSNITASSTTFSLRATAQNGTMFAGPRKPPENRRYAFTALEKQQIPLWMKDEPDETIDLAVGLEEWASDLAKEEGAKNFRKYCGDHYITTISSGAELLAVITFDAEKNTTKEELSASIQGSYSIASASASVDLDRSEDASKSHLKVSYLQVGGARGEIPTTNEDLKRKLAVLANEAADAPVFYEIGIAAYEDLPNWPASAEENPDQDELMMLLGSRDLELYTLYSHLDSVLTDPKAYSIGTDSELFQPRLRVLAELQDKILIVRSIIVQFQKERHLLELEKLRGGKVGDTTRIITLANSLSTVVLPDVDKTKLEPPAKNYDEALINVRDYLKKLNVPKMRLWLPLPAKMEKKPEDSQYAAVLVDFYLGKQSRRVCLRSPDDQGCISKAELREMEFDVLPNYHQLKLRKDATGYLFSSSAAVKGCLSASTDFAQTKIAPVDKTTTDLDSASCTLFKFVENSKNYHIQAGDKYLNLTGVRVSLGDSAEQATNWSVFIDNKLGTAIEKSSDIVCMTTEKEGRSHIGAGACSEKTPGWFLVPRMLLPQKILKLQAEAK